MKLRDYQERYVSAAIESFRTNHVVLGVAPTGVGKTIIAAEIIRKFAAESRVMCMAHTGELLDQAASKIRTLTKLGVDFEKASQRSDTGMFKAPVVMTTVQTQTAGRNGTRRFHRFNPHEFGLLWIDEGHRAIAKTYRATMDYYRQNQDLRVLLLTATPSRSDERALSQIFDDVAFQMDMDDARNEGWLVNARYMTPLIEGYDISHVSSSGGGEHKLSPKQLAVVLEDKKVLSAMAEPIFETTQTPKLKTLVFTARVQQAKELSLVLNSMRPNCSRYISGKMPQNERDANIREFKYGEFQYLINVGICTEGFDVPDIQCIAMCRPTKSTPFLVQCLGRGMRPIDGIVDQGKDASHRKQLIAESIKPNCLVIDFCGTFGKHKLSTAFDAYGGKYDDEVLALADRIMRNSDEPRMLQEVLREAQIAQLENREKERVREQQRMKQLESVGVKVKYKMREFNPFDTFRVTVPHRPAWANKDRPTPAMVGLLEKFRVEHIDRLNKAEAHALIDKLIDRQRKGRCTYRQAKVLRAQGYDVENMSFDEAHTIMGQLMSKWKGRKGWYRKKVKS